MFKFIDKYKIGKDLDSKVKTIVLDELHNTKGNKNLSYNEILEKWNEYKDKQYIKNFITKIPRNRDIKYIVYQMYFGAPQIFPSMYINMIIDEIGDKLSHLNILDPTMGWGTRYLGFKIHPKFEHYIGIDTNLNLKKYYPFDDLQADFYFMNCLEFDYSKIDYNLVFTSLPYYNTEKYNHQITTWKYKKEWNEKFYIPLWKKLYENLKLGGFIVLNIREDIYLSIKENILLPYKILNMKRKRKVSKNNKDFFYIWYKN